MSKQKEKPKKEKKKEVKKGRSRSSSSLLRRIVRILVVVVPLVFIALAIVGDWYVHQPAEWIESHRGRLTVPLEYLGDRAGMLTDALGWTGHDCVYDTDDPEPEGIFFAGVPVRVGTPAPADIVQLDRGEFVIGWSPSLRHPAWVAYRVPRESRFDVGKRPSFQRDRSVAASASPGDYVNTGYDRGHMAPNRAIVTRFGPEAQKKTFRMTNIAPQRPALNRGPWREMEQRIADLWAAKYGDIRVIVGCVPSGGARSREMLNGTQVEVPVSYWMLLAAQTPDGVRALAVLMHQTAGRWDFPTRSIVTVDELERITGYDFFPDMPKFLQSPLEADRPTRLWPVRLRDLVKLILVRFV